jgi:hypothetical protein
MLPLEALLTVYIALCIPYCKYIQYSTYNPAACWTGGRLELNILEGSRENKRTVRSVAVYSKISMDDDFEKDSHPCKEWL